MMEWPFEGSVVVTARWQYLAGMGNALQMAVYVLNQHPMYGAPCPVVRIHGFRNQWVEQELALLTITPYDPPIHVCFLFLQPYVLLVLGPKGRILRQETQQLFH